MSRLSVTAKTELKELITGQLDEMAEAINSANEPELRIIKAQAEELAIESFGCTELIEKGNEIVAERERLLYELYKIQDEQDKLLNKPSNLRTGYHYSYRDHNEVKGVSVYLDGLLPARTDHHEAILFANSEFGKQLLRIKAKGRKISKDILLATLPEQLTAVYMAFCEEFDLDG